MNEILIVISFLAIIGSICMIIHFYIEDEDEKMFYTFIFAVFSVVLLTYSIKQSNKESAKERTSTEESWKQNGCPVYKYECGSKTRYECEIKVPTVDRYDIGNSRIVQSYPTCK